MAKLRRKGTGGFLVLKLISFLLVVSLVALPVHAQDTRSIRVHHFVADNPEAQSAADLLTAKVISYLAKYGVPVVESEDHEAALLTGSIQIASVTIDGNTRYHVQGAMRLTDAHGKVLWGDVVHSNRFARSASSSFAEHVAKKVAALWRAGT
jgi:TolB-like protein